MKIVLFPGRNLSTTAIAAACDAVAGYPQRLVQRIGHPVMWIGRLTDMLDRRLNRDTDSDPVRYRNGFVAMSIIATVPCATVALVQVLAFRRLPPPLAIIAGGILGSSLSAQRSLWEHVRTVSIAARQGLPQARAAVSHIVGRDPAQLDEAAVMRAAVETLAENFSDGIVAPLLWMSLGGPAGAVFYKSVNTADSMIGHRTPRHDRFGFAAAKLDDLVNLPASRLSAVWILLAAMTMADMDARGAWRILRRDAGHHRSPNAGWPEAAMAGALGVRLSGPRSYNGVVSHEPWVGDGRADLTPHDLDRALGLYRRACMLQGGVLVALSVMLRRAWRARRPS
ncbi:adenosylcobinamide-phosphate synthase CbiB [Gluconacetobacter entanii]|uniref:adenosylcobinamide-phosphate synthase CbiB n=1 Tax=Gluconacetobacter entanii TaxID=108528 RepID=UPI001C93626B|nr:adenosylcobinamide-phosphate synthase CbiB [Gluconacetobacter entanii]MBY4639534.1 adenosylcobinamide-phosphate synthase CbiB [Gluconacetobacter entanii]MCW4579875.1 adenosylcobinamide-phosphate synthase CbiB [Gluconacetobacter entanii]MCW4583320.1 adenosylcobinamide-phosphate synthase CbiB [Gluconacetobacter entanii]MCW4586671.1 adenosylcobinamide-phosphate synthase CbiB [Gluconacetobacter entanii]